MKSINYYDANANTEEKTRLSYCERKSMNIIMNYVHANDTKSINLLDIGCGDGFFLYRLSDELRGGTPRHRLFRISVGECKEKVF